MNNQFKLQINSIFKSRTKIHSNPSNSVFFFFFFNFQKHIPIHSKNSNYVTNFPTIHYLSYYPKTPRFIRLEERSLLHSHSISRNTSRDHEYQYPSSPSASLLPFPKTRLGDFQDHEQLPSFQPDHQIISPTFSSIFKKHGLPTNSNTV